MKTYGYSAARQNLSDVLNEATVEGGVRIRRRDGRCYLIQPEPAAKSPLDVPGVETGLDRKSILGLVRDSRRSGDRFH